MKKTIVFTLLVFAGFSSVYAQKYMTKSGKIRFYSETPIEKIEALNNQVNSALDASTGSFVFKVLIKSFNFEKALMQEHFNENYMESDKFPLSTFNGKINNIADVNFAKDGTYPVTVEGDLTIHGVTKKITEKGSLTIKGGTVTGNSKFNVKPADYNIAIPKAVVKNIAETLEVTVDVVMDKLN